MQEWCCQVELGVIAGKVEFDRLFCINAHYRSITAHYHSITAYYRPITAYYRSITAYYRLSMGPGRPNVVGRQTG